MLSREECVHKGLTLVEMLVVLAIIGLLLSVGTFSLVNHRQGKIWRSQVAALEGLLQTGGQIARSSGRAVNLVISGNTAYLSQEGQALHLQGSRVIAPHLQAHLVGQLRAGELTSGTVLTWRPSGRVDGERTLQLSQEGRSHTFRLSHWGKLEVTR